MKRLAIFLSSAGLLIGSFLTSITTAFAYPIYTQFPRDANQFGGNFSGTTTKVADDFSLSAAATIRSVSWFGAYDDPGPPLYPDDNLFVVNIFSDSACVPGILLDSTPVQAYSALAGVDGVNRTYKYSADIIPLSVSAGTTYWFQVLSDTPVDWFWLQSTDGDNRLYEDLSYYGDSPYIGPGDVAFSLSNSDDPIAPEPSSVLLVATGVLGILGVIRRRGAHSFSALV